MTDDMNELIAAVGPGDAGRLVGNTELLLAPEQLTALERAVSDYWNRDMPVQAVQQTLAHILQNRRQP